jgi:hypothetical protein
MALRTFFISFHDQLPDAPLQPRQHMIALAAVSCKRMSGGLVDRHLFVTALAAPLQQQVGRADRRRRPEAQPSPLRRLHALVRLRI